MLLLLFAAHLAACEQQAAVPPARLTVKYVTIAPEKTRVTENVPGRVSALTVSEVRPQVGGIVTERLFTEGATVTEGQALYRIDPELYTTAFNEAKANLANAEANARTVRLRYERYGKLVKIGAVGVQDYDDAAADSKQADEMVRSAQEQLENARINLGYTTVTAPVSGEIGRSFITPGALVTKNQAEPMATIRQLDPIYIDVKAPSANLVSLRRALASGALTGEKHAVRARLLLEDGLPYTRLAAGEANKEAEPLTGQVLFSEVTVDQSTGTVLLRITFPNPDALLLPGMYVRVLLDAGEMQNALLVPQTALLRDTRNRPYVFTLTRSAPAGGEGGAAATAPPLGENEYYVAQRILAIGSNVGDRWLVTSGLQPGDMVLTDNLQKVRPGAVVTVSADSAPPAEKTGGAR